MRLSFIPLFIFSIVLSGYANNPKVAQLKSELAYSSSPEQSVKIYRDLSKEYYKTQVKFDTAFYYAKLAYEIAKNEDLKLEQGQVLFDQASIFRAVGDIDRAIDLYSKSIEISRKEARINSKAIRLLIATTNNMGDIYLAKKDFEQAKVYFNDVVQLTKEYEMKDIEAIAYLNLAEISYYQGDYSTSQIHIYRSSSTYPAYKETLAPYYVIASRTSLALKKTEEAGALALRGLEIARKDGDLGVAKDLAAFLSKHHQKKENFDLALDYSNLVHAYKDSLNAGANRKELDKLLLGYQLQDQENKLERMAQKNKYLTTIYVLGSMGVLLLVVLIFRQRKIVRMTKNIHEIQNNLIQTELDKRKSNPTAFQIAKYQDTEFVDPDFI